MPWPTERVVEMVAPTRAAMAIKEPVLADDPDSGDADSTPVFNAYSADGDVTGEVVYVNYGMPADYEQLKELGVDVKGKIVLARYGGGLARDQAEGRLRARRGRLPDLLGSARRRLLSRATCIRTGRSGPSRACSAAA